MHPSILAVYAFFDPSQAPEGQEALYLAFQAQADAILELCPAGPEVTVALRKALESRDCCARAIIFASHLPSQAELSERAPRAPHP